METWKPIPGHEGYEASDEGRIRSRKTGTVLSPWLRSGYPTVNLRNGKDRKLRSVHTVIAETHIGARPSGGRFHCAHRDGDKLNSRADNLVWVTPTENEQHKRQHGTFQRGSWAKIRLFTDEDAAVIREIIGLGLTQSKLAALLGVNVSTVSSIVRHQNY